MAGAIKYTDWTLPKKSTFKSTNLGRGRGGLRISTLCTNRKMLTIVNGPLVVKPQSHRIVRLPNRTIGCDLANMRTIGNVCYDLQKRRILRSVFFAGRRLSYDWSYTWSRDQHRLEKIDDKIHHIVVNRTTSGSN